MFRYSQTASSPHRVRISQHIQLRCVRPNRSASSCTLTRRRAGSNSSEPSVRLPASDSNPSDIRNRGGINEPESCNTSCGCIRSHPVWLSQVICLPRSQPRAALKSSTTAIMTLRCRCGSIPWSFRTAAFRAKSSIRGLAGFSPAPPSPVADLAEQSYVAPPVSATIGLNFEGIPNSANGAGSGRNSFR